MKRLNYALIGAGRRGAARLQAVEKLQDTYNVVAVCDMNVDRADSFAKQFGARSYTNVRELLDKEDLIVADVNTPVAAHHPVSAFFAEAGVNVISTCPTALTLPTADMMIAAANRGGVKLEICETIYRQPDNRFTYEVIESGAIGDVIRVYGVFVEGLYHGLATIRHFIGSEPTSFRTIGYSHPVTEFPDQRSGAVRHSAEDWHAAFADFKNGAMAVQIYSNVIHARALGRDKGGFTQIDGTAGAIFNEAISVVPAENMESGAKADSFPFRRVTKEVDGETVLQRIEAELPGRTVVWENPLSDLPVPEGLYREVEQLWTFAEAVHNNAEPEYSNELARQDVEISVATLESARLDGARVHLPLTDLTPTEAKMHKDFKDEFGLPIEDMDGLLEVFFPQTFSMIDLLPGQRWDNRS